jgi:hypothetical protein
MRGLFCWDRKRDKILGYKPLSKDEANPLDWVGMSPSGKWVLVAGVSGDGGKTSGLNIVDPGFSKWHRVSRTTAHSDVGTDVRGREVIVMQNPSTDYIDIVPLDPGTRPVTSSKEYAVGKARPLVRLFYSSNDPAGFSGSVHISCNVPGYCVVSTYCSPGKPERNWLDRSMILVKLDPEAPKAWYLAKIHNTTGTYWEETHATITRDGKQIVWASNWGKQVDRKTVFTMQLTMPPGWRERLK